MAKEIFKLKETAKDERLEKENAELKAQIEKMKCCENLDNWSLRR